MFNLPEFYNTFCFVHLQHLRCFFKLWCTWKNKSEIILHDFDSCLFGSCHMGHHCTVICLKTLNAVTINFASFFYVC